MSKNIERQRPGRRPLTDSFGRSITYLRLSLTDRCNLRCRYCMSEAMTFLPREDVLTIGEIGEIADAFVAPGVRKSGSTTVNRWYEPVSMSSCDISGDISKRRRSTS